MQHGIVLPRYDNNNIFIYCVVLRNLLYVQDSSPVSWIACGYPEGTTNQLVVKTIVLCLFIRATVVCYQAYFSSNLKFKREGSGGMPEFIASLPTDDVVWGAVKVCYKR